MRKLLDYAISLTHLYGLVHKDKVVEIYNMQNDEEIDCDAINEIFENGVNEGFVETHGDYFVHESILEYDNFDEELEQRRGKPHYIPEQDALLKYVDEYYSEKPKEYYALVEYAAKNLFHGDEYQAEVLTDNFHGVCQFAFSINNVFEIFNLQKVNFKNEQQVSEVMELLMDLANNTRLWENNGHTPNEIFSKMEKPHLRPLPKGGFPDFHADTMDRPKLRSIPGGASKKVGRNDPCPCGSGKKYKKCCLGKENKG
ncbi:YecA family protein [Candidatus Contubernalis alkaliaceticus]|uniref:YecA family protein n=1 Tax=Candidatus Contubernalis alkaliaceticus TaxID=338645 RepID=UPI002409BFB5|nr:SEC-C metal-binding domain-containing protein [Candidatus Contubernalis alkalaceticus]UNC93526.1 SEC-C domain-containing protein [Candidatus Contubernalis alkalaceticus]